MEKEMEKEEILKKLRELEADLLKNPDDYITEYNEAHPDAGHKMTKGDYWPYMIGATIARIEFILNGDI